MPKLVCACLCFIPILLASRLLHAAPAGEGEPTYHRKTLKQWIELSRDDDPKVRRRAVVNLGMGPFNKAAVPALCARLKDTDREIRLAAVEALGLIGRDAASAVDDLVAAMKEGDLQVRIAICETLGELDAAAVPALIRAMKDEQWRVRESACYLLRRSGPEAKDAAPALISGLREDPDVRSFCRVETLVQIGEVAVPLLIEAMNDANPEVQSSATSALAKIKPPSKRAVAALAQRLKHPNKEVRAAAATALGELQPDATDGIDALAKALNDVDGQVRLDAAKALGKFGPKAATTIPGLIDLLKDDDDPIARASALSLTQIGKSAVPALTEAIADEQTARFAAFALGFIGEPAVPALKEGLQKEDRAQRAKILKGYAESLDDMYFADPDEGYLPNRSLHARSDEGFALIAPDVLPLLVAGLDDEEPELRLTAARCLQRFYKDGKTTQEPLMRLLSDKDAKTRRAALGALAAIEPCTDEITQSIAAALMDPDSNVTDEAAWVLSTRNLPAKAVLPSLIKALQHQKIGIRTDAMEAIGKLGSDGKPAIASLKDAIGDRDARVQLAAAMALARVDPENEHSIPTLIRILNVVRSDPQQERSSSLAYKAAKTLGSLGPKAESAIPALIQALHDKSQEVRKTAAKALGEITAQNNATVLSELSEMLLDSTRSDDICAAALSKFGAAALPALSKALQSSDKRICAAGTHGLQKLGAKSKPAIAALTELLYDEDTDVRQEAVKALGAIGPDARDAVSALSEAARARNDGVRRAAVISLGKIGPTSAAISALEPALSDPEDSVREPAAEMLGQWGKVAESAAPSLRAACKDAEGRVRVKAATALCTVMPDKKDGKACLVAALHDQELFIRVLAAEALWDVDENNEGLPALLEAIKDPYEAGYSMGILTKMGPAAKGIVPDLLRLTENKYGRSCHAAIEALKAIDPEAAKKAGGR